MDSESMNSSAHVDDHPSPLDLPSFLVYATERFQATYTLRVTVNVAFEMANVDAKKPRRPSVPTGASRAQVDDDETEKELSEEEDADLIDLFLIQDKQGRFTEILLHRCRMVPQMLLKILGYCIPFHPLLNRINVRWTPLTAVCLYEISRLLCGDESRITEICLDDSPVSGRNYYVLLEQASALRVLSLARCSLDDDDISLIALLLAYPQPASKTLNLLNLSTNKIGDIGACALGHILRSNRSLQYINLTGNRVTSVGAISILESLKEFALSMEEISDKRMRLIDYIQQKEAVYKKCLAEVSDRPLEAVSRKSFTRSRVVKTKVCTSSTSYGGTQQERALALALEIVGESTEPFTGDQIMTYEDRTYSFGNMSLSYLNLSYNNLDYDSIPVLLEVLKYQCCVVNKKGTGLLHVQITGNKLPVRCSEYASIDELIEKAITIRIKPPSTGTSAVSRRLK